MEQNQSPGLNSYVKSELIYNKGAKTTQWGEESFFSKDLGKITQSYAKEGNWTPTLYRTQKSTQNGLMTGM